MTYPCQRTEHAGSGTESERHVLSAWIPLGQTPSLRPLLRRHTFGTGRCQRCVSFVRRLRRYYGSVRLPVSVHHRRASLDFPMRPTEPSWAAGHRISRFSREVLPHMHGVSDRAGSRRISRWRCFRCCLPLLLTASAPRREFLSRLNTRPARTPVNASPLPLRATTHDSGPSWAANPSTYDFCIHYTSPVYLGAQGDES